MKNNNEMHNAPIHDDPLLTAYALGELDGEVASMFDRQLAGDAALRAEVDAIRSTASMLRAGFAAEPVQTLTASQRSNVMKQVPNQMQGQPALKLVRDGAASEVVVTRSAFMSRSRWIGSGLAAAAMITLTVTAAMIYFNGRVDTNGFAIGDRDKGALPPISAASGSRSDFEAGRGRTQTGADPRSGAVDESAKKDKQELADGSNLRKEAKPGARESGEARGVDTSFQSLEAAASEAAPPPPPTPPPAGVAPAIAQNPTPLSAESPSPNPAPGRPAGAAAPSTASPSSSGPQGGAGAGAAGATGSAGGAAAPGDGVGGGGRGAQESKSDPASSLQPDAAGAPVNQPAPVTATPAEDSTRSRDADDRAAGNRGGLRDPSHRQSETRPEAAPRYEEERIAAMDEGQVHEALENTRRAKEAEGLDSRTKAQLAAQDARLVERLRAIERTDAEEYSRINDNPFIKPVGEAALSTFALDVDTASYSNIRRFLAEGRLPPADAVRIEEMINYFKYDYPPPTAAEGEEKAAPFSANLELAAAPWNPAHRLLRVGIRGEEVRMDMRPATSLVFLIDVSGSMNQPNKLPLVKDALNLLIQQLNGDDRLAIVTYAGNAGLVLDSCFVNAANRVQIDAAIENMQPGGSTNGAGGINLAYDVAKKHFITDGINRVILCTDGDFNVGVSGDEALVQLIEEQRKSNVFLTVLGFGRGNFKDAKMERLTNAGNGNFAYIDSIKEAKKVLVEQAGGTLVTIAKDVKFQVEFNPAKVGAYRLIGYENRLLAAEDFNNDLKDAGEIGSGHTMTALYEIVPVGEEAAALAKNDPHGEVDELKYQKPVPAGAAAAGVDSDELLEVKIRYKQPDGDTSSLLRFPLKDQPVSDRPASNDFRFAAAVAEFGMLLRRSQYVAGGTFDHVIAEAEGSMGEDDEGYRAEFIEMVKKAKAIEQQ